MRARSVLQFLVLAACAASPPARPSPTPIARPDVPDAIAVPAGNDVGLVAHANGVQVYECGADGTWKLRAPRATLEGPAGPIGEHFGGVDRSLPAGPYWRSARDGSSVHAGNAASAQNPGQIPLLRLQALDHAGDGILSRVTYVQRLATSGGLAPGGPCTAGAAPVEVPYSADYVFYVPRS